MNNSLLEFFTPINEKTGELKNFSIAYYNCLKFKVYTNGRITIQGSLHKFYNSIFYNSPINHDLFSLQKLITVLNILEEDFEINPYKAEIHSLEFGFNIIVPMEVQDIIDCLISYKGHSFSKMRSFRNERINGIECYFSEYGIKIYDKSLQYGLSETVIRFEKKFLKMRNLFDKPITLIDLINPNTWTLCVEALLNCVDNLLVIEPTKRELTEKEQRAIDLGTNQIFWKTLSKQKRHLHKKQIDNIMQKNGQYRIKDMFKSLIMDAYTEALLLRKAPYEII